jgi:2-phospho-L-lactate guanylyltransferase
MTDRPRKRWIRHDERRSFPSHTDGVSIALVPVKSLAASKSRLLPHLGPTSARRLSTAMLADVLEALLAVPTLSRVAVVTPDGEVAMAARAAGAEALRLPVAGLNPSIDAAARELTGPDDTLLVLLGDVAGARVTDLCALLEETPARGVALAPSSDGGTAALVRRPHDVIPAGFGPESAKRHRELAENAGVPCISFPLPSLVLDLDEPEDLERFLETSEGGSHTRALLLELREAARR